MSSASSDNPSVRIHPLAEADIDDVLALSASEFDAEPGIKRDLEREVSEWQRLRSSTVVARIEGVFAGYARSKPTENAYGPRPEGQVAVLAQLAVVEGYRHRGVGAALVVRATKTLKLLGYARAITQFDGTLAPWYETQGWTVLPEGEALVWIEPHIQRDDLWFPARPAGQFSPVLRMPFNRRFARQAVLTLRDAPPIIEALYATGPLGRDEDANADVALGDALAAHPAALKRLPPLLVELLRESPTASPAFVEALT